jgi:hypothetical protein
MIDYCSLLCHRSSRELVDEVGQLFGSLQGNRVVVARPNATHTSMTFQAR